jgi:hypothetical protein
LSNLYDSGMPGQTGIYSGGSDPCDSPTSPVRSEPGLITEIMDLGHLRRALHHTDEQLPRGQFVVLVAGYIAIAVGASLILGIVLYEHVGGLTSYWDMVTLVMLLVGAMAYTLLSRSYTVRSLVLGIVTILSIGLAAGANFKQGLYSYHPYDALMLLPKTAMVLLVVLIGAVVDDIQSKRWYGPALVLSIFARAALYAFAATYVLSLHLGRTITGSHLAMTFVALYAAHHVFVYANQARHGDRTVGDLLVLAPRMAMMLFVTWVALAAIY